MKKTLTTGKEFISTQKYLIMSPRKIRLVTDLIKKMKPAEAVEKLPFVQKKAAAYVSKVIKSALANAKAQGVGETELIIKEIQVSEGPRLKRGMAASRGRWHQFKHRMSHIRVVLATTVKSEAPKAKSETKIEDSKVKNQKAKVQVKNEKVEKKGDKISSK